MWRGFLTKVVCEILEEGFERGQVWPLYEPSNTAGKTKGEQEKESGGSIKRMIRFENRKGNQHEQRGRRKGKKNLKRRKKQNREQTATTYASSS